MTAEEVSASVDAIIASISTIKYAARKSCGPSDVKRAAHSMGALIGGKVESPLGEGGVEMLADLLFFEPNEHGIRPFDRFLSGPARTLPDHEQEIARRMGRGFFSIFRLAEKHETLGTWVEDILDNDRRLWVVDLDVDEENPSHTAFAVRMFDAGPFHMTLSVITSISERMVNVFKRAHATGRLPYRRSLPATIHGLTHLGGAPPTHMGGWKFVNDLGAELRPGGT
jgi:hypothetical protein